MRITVRNLLIFVACVGLALGQARLTPVVGIACLVPELLLLAYLLPRRLRSWLVAGVFLGNLAGTFACAALIRGTDVSPASFPTWDAFRVVHEERMAMIDRFGPYCFQGGALLGGMAGLIVGQFRSREGTRAARLLAPSDEHRTTR